MNKSLFILLLLIPSVGLADMPTQVGGFTLNSDIDQYESQLISETTMPIRFMEAIKEVEIVGSAGFKSGYVAYGSCAAPGKIVRIKLKYRDSSEGFYKKLLKSYKKNFGKPKWLGDPFHVVSTWRWTFEQGDQRIFLYLQHNLSDTEEKFGNSVKLTMANMVQDEMECFSEKHPDFRNSGQASGKGGTVNWEDLLPR